MIIEDICRKIDQLLHDPILRRWLWGALIGKWRTAYPVRGVPPYLPNDIAPGLLASADKFPDLVTNEPDESFSLKLHGKLYTVNFGQETAFLAQDFGDTETLLAFHRFTWLSQAVASDNIDWAAHLWRLWGARFGADKTGWAWHPYTIAERLINIVQFIERYGVPSPRRETLEILECSGAAILQTLEYFGETATGNHLANNGRGLYLSGLALGESTWIEAGASILINEARRIFNTSGILREGSTHYHLLVSRWYAECWLAARRAGRPEEAELKGIVERALWACPKFVLSGGFPIIGDVSPDCEPDFLLCLCDGTRTGWYATLVDEDFRTLSDLVAVSASSAPVDLGLCDWLRRDIGPWSALWPTPEMGWAPFPGHAHQDFASCEIHYGRQPLFRDLGRRSYDAHGASDVAASAHNSLMIDGWAPYPVNRPYYNDEFRRAITGAPPQWTSDSNIVAVRSGAFARARGLGAWRREWRFTSNGLCIVDRIEGSGSHKIERRLHTTLPVERDGADLKIGTFRLFGAGNAEVYPTDRWPAYGQREAASTIVLGHMATLPWSGEIQIEAEIL